MAKLMPYLHWICGLVVLAESPQQVGAYRPAQGTDWVLGAPAPRGLAEGHRLAAARPGRCRRDSRSHFRTHPPALADVCLLAGFAVLIVRTRFKEG